MKKPAFFILGLFIFFQITVSGLVADELRVDFLSGANMQYNTTNMELYNNTLRLTPTAWFWTNTPDKIKYDSLGYLMFQDSAGLLFYSASHMGGPPYKTYRTGDYGNTWTNVYNNTFIGLIEASDHNLYGTVSYSAGVTRSMDHGTTWTTLILYGSYGGGICEDSSHLLYASFHKDSMIPPQFATNYLFRSSDYGATWTNIYKEGLTNSSSDPIFFWLYALPDDRLLAYRNGVGNLPSGLCISTNHGYNWKLISALSNSYFSGILQAKDGSFYIYGDAGVVRSSDGCRTFITISTQGCSSLIEADNGLFFLTSTISVPARKIFRSYDKCSTWEPLNNLIRGSGNFNTYLGERIIQAADRKLYIGGATNEFDSGYVFKSGYVLSNACIISPAAPVSVNQWTSFSKSEVLNGGSINYEFSSSSDGGVTWSSWLTLSDANLQAVKCLGNGKDLIKVRATLYSLNHNTTPEISGIVIQYESGIKDSLDKAVIAPNPVKPDSPDSSVVFYNLTPDSEISVYTITGRPIIKLKSTEINRLVWNTRDSHGKPLPAGVYTCFITDSLGHKKSLPLIIKR